MSKEAYAYDPVRDEDVRIDCHREVPHDFDVREAVQDREYPRNGDREQARDHPMLVSADFARPTIRSRNSAGESHSDSPDFDHDPVEACQGTMTEIVERDCPVCGYDRMDHTTNTMGGVHNFTCRRCGSSATDGGTFTPPTLKGDRWNELTVNNDDSVLLNKLGGTSSRLTNSGRSLYRNDECMSRPYFYLQDSSGPGWASISEHEMRDLVRALARDGALDLETWCAALDRYVDEAQPTEEEIRDAVPYWLGVHLMLSLLDDEAVEKLGEGEDDG